MLGFRQENKELPLLDTLITLPSYKTVNNNNVHGQNKFVSYWVVILLIRIIIKGV